MKRNHSNFTLTCALAVLVVAFAPGLGATETGDGFDAAPSQPIEADGPDGVVQTWSYYNILGSALQPRDSGNTVAYSGNGCIYVTGGPSDRLQFPVLLPRFSDIRYIRIFYLDTNATDLQVWLTRYDPGSTAVDVGSVTSSGTAGTGTALSPELSHISDGLSNYTLNFGWSGVANSTLQICGVRIAYYDPVQAGLLFTDDFESGNTSGWGVVLP